MSQHLPFTFEFEFETFEKASAGPGKERRIGGIVSTDHMDKQSEKLIQSGLDFSPFLKGGFFNDNHSKATGAAVGYPEMAELRKLPDGSSGWYVEGYLLKGHPPADDIWNLATSLERSGAARKLGFSVEGQIIERDPTDPTIVKKAVVREVAVTRCPVNDNTQLSVLAKSLSVGHAGPGGNSGTPGAAAPLSQESLEADASPRPKADEDDDEDNPSPKKKLTKSEAVLLLMRRNPMISETSATRIVEFALRRQNAA